MTPAALARDVVAILRRIVLLSSVRLPVQVHSRDLSGGPQRWGPFAPGAVLRVQVAEGDVYVAAGGGAVVASDAGGVGVPMGSWSWQDFEVPAGDGPVWVSVALASGSDAGRAAVWASGTAV